MESQNNNNKIMNNQNEKENYQKFGENKINEENSEEYIFDYNSILQKIQKDKNKGKNRKNEYLCNLLNICAELTPIGKIEIIKFLYSFNSNPKDKNYKYYIFKELNNAIDNLNKNQNDIIEINFYKYIEILLEQGKFFKEEENYFYSYFYLYNALYRDIPNIKNLRKTVKEKMIDLNNQNMEKFIKMNNNEYKEIYHILLNIVKNNIIQNIKEMLYVINIAWLKRALNFIRNIQEYGAYDLNLNKSFHLYQIYNYYFNYESENNLNPYPDKIENFSITDFEDIWKDPVNEDENYLIKNNVTLGKDYCLVEKKYYDKIKDIFGATNEIKRKIDNLDLIKIKVIILDKRIVKMRCLNLLKPKFIQTQKNNDIKKFKEKIKRCVNYTLSINELDNDIINKEEENNENIDEKNTCDEDINMTDLTNIKNNENIEMENELINNINIYDNSNNNINRKKEDIFFYRLGQENKELLTEIFTAFINDIPKYESIYIEKINLKDEDPLELLLKNYNDNKEFLIIEVGSDNLDSFLTQKEKKDNKFYQCSNCKKWESFENMYNCIKCHMSLFCSKKCCETLLNNNHIRFHEYLKEYQIKKINDENKYKNYSLVGLANLGNTCFINSTLQCLFNTSDLSYYFLNNYYKKEINLQNKQGYSGKIAEAFANLLKKVKNSNAPKISPIDFLKTFFTNNNSLSLRNQQDAQEFLSILLDCLHEDLNRITNKPYFELEEQKDNETDSEASQRFWDLYKKREDSIIVDLFHGQFKSKITCSTCNKTSKTYEAFIFLGLPIPQQYNQEIIKFFFGNKWEFFGFDIKDNSTIFDLKQKAISHMKMCGYAKDESNDILSNVIEFVQFDNNKIIKNIYNENNPISDNELLSALTKDKNEIVLYEKILDKNFFNIYAYPIKGDDYDSSSYPISLSVNGDMTLENIIQMYKNKISQMYANINDNDNIIIGLLHKKNNGWAYYLTNMFDNREYCPLCSNKEDNFCIFNNNFKISYILKNLRNYHPVLFVIGFSNKKLINKPLHVPDKVSNGFFFLNDCLKLFCEEENLNKDNKWYCNNCKKHKNAKKQIRFFKLPKYLIIQLKKFQNSAGFFYSSNEKKNCFIKYPINNLDLSNFSENNQDNNQKYDLYAVIEHYGEISEGHYTAICKLNDIWVLYNDSILSRINDPVTSNAYLLFYKKHE